MSTPLGPVAPRGITEPTSDATEHNTPNSASLSPSPKEDDTEKVSIEATNPEPPRSVKGWRFFLVLVAIYSSTFLYGLDNTIVADIQSALIADFGNIEKLSWIGVGFPLGSIACILPYGKAFGSFDNKWLYLSGILFFAVGSALCGGAPNIDALIVGRVIAGSGGAGQYLGVLNLLTRFTSNHERPVYMGFLGLTWGAGTILGPVIGGSFADSSATWRWGFYINLLIFGAFTPIYFFFLPSAQPQPDVKFLAKIRTTDWLGTLINAGIYVSWVVVLTFGGATWAWNDGRTIALWVVLGVLIIAFSLQQGFSFITTPENRIFPVTLLKSRSMLLLFLATCCAASALFITVYYIPLYFEFVHGDNGLKSAVRLLPFIVMTVTFALINGGTMPVFGYYMPWYIASGILMLIGGALMYTVNASTSISVIYGYTVLLGIGTGMTSQSAYSIAPARLALAGDWQSIPSAIALMNIAQVGSIVHALAISGTVFQNYAYQNMVVALAGLDFTDAEIRAAIAGSQSKVFLTVSEAVRDQAIEAIVGAVQKVYILAIVAGAVGLLAGAFMRREKLFMEMTAGA